MGQYLDQIDATAPAARWAAVRKLIFQTNPAFLAELRDERPVLVLPELTLVSRHADCTLVLRRNQTFCVDLYAPKQGGYFMAQDDTASHWRDKSVMKAILDVEDIPRMRDWIGTTTRDALDAAQGQIELVRGVTRGVPVALVQHWFGLTGADPDKLIEWSYWNQQDAFWNQPFDAVAEGIDPDLIVTSRKRANIMMALYLGRLILGRSVVVKLGSDATDPVSRLLRLSFSDSVKFHLRDTIFNVGGLLIGAVETTSHTVVNALAYLAADPARREAAIRAAQADDPAAFDGHVFEALRFRPAFPYFFRVCHRPTELAGGTAHATEIAPGTTVLALTHAAMFDRTGYPDPDRFDPTRDQSDSFTFGQGMHSCLGRHIAAVMVPEITRQILRRGDLDFGAGPDFGGTAVPQHWQVSFRR